MNGMNGKVAGIAVILLLGLPGCGKSSSEGKAVTSAPKPKAAASQLEQAFTSASVEVKKEATVASQALRTANYEEALHSLYTVKKQGNLTLEQGIAVQNSMASLESALIAGMNAGDSKARKAYELLRELSRD